VEKLRNCARLLPSEGHLDDLVSFIVVAFIGDILHLRCSVLDLEPEGIVNSLGIVLVVLVVEEGPKNDLLVVPHHKVFSSDERREQPEMFGGHVSCCRTGLLEKGSDLTVDGLAGYHVLDRLRVVLEDGQQTFLDETSIDLVGVFYEELQPSREENFIVLEILNSMLDQYVTQLEYLCYLETLGSVIGDLVS
jgi:hypothetical protein